MGIVTRNRSFLIAVLLILVCGAAILGGVTAIRVFAEDATPIAATTTESNMNKAGSYGITGYSELKLEPTDETMTPGAGGDRPRDRRLAAYRRVLVEESPVDGERRRHARTAPLLERQLLD